MKIRDSIAKWVMGDYSFVGKENGKSYLPDFSEARQEFSQAVFTSIVELVTDIANDVTLILKSGNQMLFADFNLFFLQNGQLVLNKLFNSGFAVIAYNNAGFVLVDDDDYSLDSKNRVKLNTTRYKNNETYVLKSDSFIANGMSDKLFLKGFLTYLDNILNASNTTTARLGSLVMATPQTPSGSPTLATISKTDKETIETDISENYGSLKSQKQILIWRQPMQFSTINLSGLDAKTIDKAKFAILAICSKLKIPANQVPMIEGASSNGLSNGGEISEGDLLKYKTFERLLSKTFVRMAKDLDLVIDYSIYNKPTAATDNNVIAEDGTTTPSIQEVSLNGAQISGLLEILANVSAGIVDRDAAASIIVSAFPQISKIEADAILEGVNVKPVAQLATPTQI